MSEIKPIDWDALPKVWAWDAGYEDNATECIWLGGVKREEFECCVKKQYQIIVRYFEFISETDPRIKTPKMRVMTAEELNDIYWEFGKDFRYRINSLAPIFGFYNYSLGTKIESNEQYSTDRGKTWKKCEVAE